MAITLKDITMDYIRNYCVDNNEKEWYNATVTTPIERPIYPKDANGKLDKKQAPIGTKKDKITFIELRTAFVAKFMPELAPKKKGKGVSMYDLL